MRTIGPWKLHEDNKCRSAVYHEEKAGQSMSGMVIERKPCFGLRIAEQRRHEILCDLEASNQKLKTVDDEALYDTYGHPVTIVSRTAKTITVTNRWEETFRIPVSKFKDGHAFHGRHSFVWGSCQRSLFQAAVANSERHLALAEADCVKWRQRLTGDPDGWFND